MTKGISAIKKKKKSNLVQDFNLVHPRPFSKMIPITPEERS